VLKTDDRLHWFDAAGAPCGEQVLPASELVAPPVTRLLTGGAEREVVVATALNAFVLPARGEPVALRERDPIACSGSQVAEARGWPPSVRARGPHRACPELPWRARATVDHAPLRGA